MDYFLVGLQKFLFVSMSLLPLGLGTVAAIRQLKASAENLFLCHLAASMAAGAVTVFLLWGSFFGDDLSSSSTASLVFVVAPVYAAVVQGIVYGVAKAVFRHRPTTGVISQPARQALLLPVVMLLVLLVGTLNISTANNDVSVAERSDHPQTLHRLLHDSKSGKANGKPLGHALAEVPL